MKGQNCDGPVRRMLLVLPASAVFLGVVVLGGCGTENDPITVNSAADIAQESSADYDDNVNGLISGATMMNWLDNWPANRPPGITGKLVILQTGRGASDGVGGFTADGWGDWVTNREFLRHNDTNVFTYAVSSGAWVQTRSNGVVFTGNMVADGTQMDALLKRYNIDPTKDMIVFAMGYGSNNANWIIGRGWYMFRYWGIDKKNLAILNGGIDGANIITNASYFDSTPSASPNTGTAVISQIRVDNTALQASLQEMLAVAKAEGPDGNVMQTTVPAGGALILDARGNSTDEYDGSTPNRTNSGGANCGGAGTSQCVVGFEGHIAGAVPGSFGDGFDYRTLLDTDPANRNNPNDPANAFMYMPKGNISSSIFGAGYVPGNTVYTYCRTTYRAMVTGIATGVILGYPTKFYDGGWVEWGRMAAVTNGLSWNSPWRTDLTTVSTPVNYNTANRIDPLSIVDEYAPDANALIDADKGYKWGAESTDEAPGGGGGGGGCG